MGSSLSKMSSRSSHYSEIELITCTMIYPNVTISHTEIPLKLTEIKLVETNLFLFIYQGD